jgi:chaperonin GroEL
MEISKVYFADDALIEILKGVDILANAVKSTMGPSGGTVIIDKPGQGPHLTKDGVTVAKSIVLQDRLQNIGASIIKEAAHRTAETAGDGTTTSTVIAQELAKQITKMSSAGFDAREMYQAIQDGVDDIVKELSELTSMVEDEKDLQNIAKISANGEQVVADAVAKAFQHVGPTGTVTVEEAKGFETSIDLVDGTELDRGYLSHYFATDTNNTECKLENADVLVIDGTVKSFQQIIPFVSRAHESSTPLIMIASDFDNDVVQSLVVNKMKAGLKICALRAPEFGQARTTTLADLSILFGGEVLLDTEASKIANDEIEKYLGSTKTASINRSKSLFVGVGGSPARVKEIVKDIVTQMEDPTLSDSEKKFAQRRKARLANGIAVIRVGGDTSSEVVERLDRVDDAIQATKAALTEGFVPGGGITLAKLSEKCLKEKRSNSDSYNVGLRTLKEACHAPVRQILCSFEDSESLIKQAKKKSGKYTVNAVTGEIENAIESGIIDPTKVVRLSVINAASAALNLLRVKCAAIIQETDNSLETEIFIDQNV